MNEDDIYKNRDAMLVRMDANLEHIKNWTEDHDKKDDERFKEVNNKILWGAISIIIIAAGTGYLPQILGAVGVK